MSIVRAIISLSLCVATLLAAGCSKDEAYLHDVSSEALAFSCDTLAFDTVFTTVGTTTRQVKVYNRADQPVLLTTVTLAGGRGSHFRLNVDGDTSMVARQVRIDAGDSIFIFVQATISPNDQNEPFLVTDAIVFSPEGCREQRLPLTAYGRNAVYHLPTDTLDAGLDRYGNPYRYSVIDCEGWNHDLPHVIVGYAVVDSSAELRLLPGEELYFATDAVLWVYNGGTLTVEGTEEQPVLFTSLRHDGWYNTLPGQWGHIWLGGVSGGGSKGCTMRHAKIENSYFGIIADSNDYDVPTLDMEWVEIGHIKVAALQLNDAWVAGNHLLLYDCGGATIYIPMGGRYQFKNVTSANYWRYDRRETPSLIVANWYESLSGKVLRDLSEATFENSIFYGSHPVEIMADEASGAAFEFRLRHCLVRGGDWDEDPLFVNVDEDDYHLQDDTPAAGMGYYDGEL